MVRTRAVRCIVPVGGWGLSSLLMQKFRLSRLTAGLLWVVVATTAAWEIFATDLELPPGVAVTSKSKTHVHANISALRTEDFPALAKIHALYMVGFSGASSSGRGEKGKAVRSAKQAR